MNNMTNLKVNSGWSKQDMRSIPADLKRPEIKGVTYGGMMHRFSTDQAVIDYCNKVLGGYIAHACMHDGSTWIPVVLATRIFLEHDDMIAKQIGWNR